MALDILFILINAMLYMVHRTERIHRHGHRCIQRSVPRLYMLCLTGLAVTTRAQRRVRRDEFDGASRGG